jgi:hypothetical protein
VQLRKFSAGEGPSLAQTQKQSARCVNDPLTDDDHLDVVPNLDSVTATNTSLETAIDYCTKLDGLFAIYETGPSMCVWRVPGGVFLEVAIRLSPF